MNQQPRIVTLSEKKLIGTHITTSLVNNRIGELWRSFMPQRKHISNSVSADLFSLSVYDPEYFKAFNPAREFEKWALMEVTDFSNVPSGMETFTLPGGAYAVFVHKGSHEDVRTFQYIFSMWLPQASYLLDNRPHFELLGSKYKQGSPDSEEEIWVPVKPKR
ncbi:MAG: GyrI-like domain-containing protein [Cyclobacteriaceae bacterium]|nr:GyrI-like domain-containing protein [Cyclobacteriaceae bacterium]